MATQTAQHTPDHERPPPPPPPSPRIFDEQEPFDWRRNGALFWANVKYWAFQILVKFVGLGIIYVAVISEGLRVLVPALAQKLYKLPIPGAPLLEDDEAGHRLDLAHVFAVFLLVAVFHLWVEVLRYWLRPDESEDEGWDIGKYRKLIVGLGCVILGSDGCLFFYAITQMGWTGGGFSITALIATAAYLAIVIYVSYVSLTLKQNVLALATED